MPRKSKDQKHYTSLRLPKDQYEEFGKACDEIQATRSSVLRALICAFNQGRIKYLIQGEAVGES